MLAMTAMFLVALATGGVLVCLGAHASVQTEMRGALAGALEVAGGALTHPPAETRADFVPDLVGRFDGQRHIRVTALRPSGEGWAQSRPSLAGARPPAWFGRLVGVEPRALRLPLPPRIAPPGSVLVFETDPTNEIAEVWRQSFNAVAIMLLLSGGAGLAIYLVVGHTLRRFEGVEGALRDIADGHYDVALDERGPPEFVALARGFNRMAGRIRDYQQRNRDLNEHILTLQAEERAEIARDLHDEVGPYLFAINVDAGDIPRLARVNDRAAIADRALSIREAAAHIQTHVRAILQQLRPTEALAFGLGAAVDDLVAFWSRRCPDVALSVEIALDGAALDPRIEDVAYRLIQESLSNAVRHGRPTRVAVAIALAPDDRLCITVTDDGAGLRESAPRTGMGLAGMAERVRALKGDFELADAVDGAGGTRARARLPLRPERRRAALAAS
jgi:two-component system sensor histidine kinase UhpB